MGSFSALLKGNRNYRNCWLGQVVSEIGDHFNSIAVLSMALHLTGSGATVGGAMLARVGPALLAAPLAGVLLDRMDRRRVMIASDLIRAAVAAAHLLLLVYPKTWLLYLLSALLTFAAPFFNSGRAAILPRIVSREELHAANALTQTTGWLTVALGTMLGGLSTSWLGYRGAFLINAASFLWSAWAISTLHAEGGFTAERGRKGPGQSGLAEFREGIRYILSRPLILGILLLGAGWATGGGAAQILFTLFGEQVFAKGPAGTGFLWGFAGFGLVAGGLLARRWEGHLNFRLYKHTVTVTFLLHGLFYMMFSVAQGIWQAAAFIFLSRLCVALNSVMNRTMLLLHVPDRLRGRVFTAAEGITNGVMMISMAAAAVAAAQYSPRQIGFVAGALSASTALFWAWANAAGKLPEPEQDWQEPEGEFRDPVTAA
ncbi:MAG: MFS transporter [Bryobacteraceae bacterium]|nr:MFS transporter [Bryobacteraceae bacterium]MCX7604128.1 MFS transporter [Bryobacteraceae bacterium]